MGTQCSKIYKTTADTAKEGSCRLETDFYQEGSVSLKILILYFLYLRHTINNFIHKRKGKCKTNDQTSDLTIKELVQTAINMNISLNFIIACQLLQALTSTTKLHKTN